MARVEQRVQPNPKPMDLDGVRPWAVLFSSRSGSTLASALIARSYRTNLAKESFRPKHLDSLYYSTVDHAQAQIRASGQFGVFGVKLGRESVLASIRLGLFGSEQHRGFVLVQRADIVAQSVSLALAKATGNWHRYGTAPDIEPELTDEGLRTLAEAALNEVRHILTAERTFLEIARELEWRLAVVKYPENGAPAIPRLRFLRKRFREKKEAARAPLKLRGTASSHLRDYLESSFPEAIQAAIASRQQLIKEAGFLEDKC